MARYRDAVEWIARNDEPDIDEADDMVDLISVLLVADLFDKNPYTVAHDIINFRRRDS